MKYIFYASIKHIDQFLVSTLLAITIIYSYSLIIAINFSNDFNTTSEVVVCDRFLTCFISTINQGLRNGGGIAESLSFVQYGSVLYFTRFFFDIIFFLLINIIFLNIL